MNKNVQYISDALLCSACGACEGVCPRGAVRVLPIPSGFYAAVVDKVDCTNCGLCVKGCPSVASEAPLLIGEERTAAIGIAADETICRNGQSGGAVTAILLHLLETNKIDGAVVTINNEVGQPEAVWADTRESICAASGSIYAQSQVVKVLLENKGKRAAVVALGCQSRAIDRLCHSIPSVTRPEYVIGLICGGNMSLLMKDSLVKRMKIRRSASNMRFRYRDKRVGGWPGAPTLEVDGNVHELSKEERMIMKPAYECYRCVLCADKMNIHCDLLAGDPWGIEPEGSKGKSAIIAYTAKGESLLGELRKNVLQVESVDSAAIRSGQKINTAFANKIKKATAVALENNWLLPYAASASDECATDLQDMQKRLQYDRRFYTAASTFEAQKLANKKIRQFRQPTKTFFYNLKKELSDKRREL